MSVNGHIDIINFNTLGLGVVDDLLDGILGVGSERSNVVLGILLVLESHHHTWEEDLSFSISHLLE